MPEAQASVVLHPVSPLGPESSLTRSFALSKGNPVFEIGRSSKREVKNRTPAKDNGWFDSRVMSRDHAELGFKMDPQEMIYIRDYGSTHGTFLNNVKLLAGEDTPLLDGDILRFGVDVDRGDEEFPALSVRCNVTWSEPTTHKPEISPTDPSDMLYNESAEPAPTTSKPIPELRPSSSTNTFCVPDDDESDVEEVTANQIPSFKVGDGNFTVIYDGNDQVGYQPPHGQELSSHLGQNSKPDDSQLIDYSEEDHLINNSESSDGDDSDFGSEPSLYSQASHEEEEANHFNYFGVPYPVSDAEISGSDNNSDLESDADYDDEYSVGQDEDDEECIDPSMLTHKDNLATPTITEAISNFTAAGIIAKPCFSIEAQERGSTSAHDPPTIFPTHFPLTPITPLLDHKCEEDDRSQRLGHLSIRDVLNNYQDGPFAGPTNSTSKDASLKEESMDGSASPTPLKRKASEMESQDAQILDSIVPPSEKLELETISQSQVAEAISSALSEGSDVEHPRKRVKATHRTSSNLASYTATAVISALLGGLGTIALLAALPAEYFQ